MSPPMQTAPTKLKGNSMAEPSCAEIAGGLRGPFTSGSGLSLDSEGIVSKPSEWFRIQPCRQGYKQGCAESDGLGAAHDRRGSIARLSEPGVNDDAEIVIHRGDDVERGENGEDGVMRFDEREKDEVLAHEACGGRDASKRKHEDEEKDGGGGAALVEAIEVGEFVADDAALAKN